jgi:hypothetical protein
MTLTTELLDVPTASLIHDNYRDLDTAHVARIAANMASEGYDDTYRLRVRPLPGEQWQIVDGHHRAAAAVMAELPTVPVIIVREASGSALRLQQLRANMGNRQDDDVTLAETFQTLVDNGETVASIAAAITRTTRYVENRLSLMKLDPYTRGIVGGRGMEYASCVSHLPYDAQREAVRALAEHPEWNLATWRVMAERIGQDYLARVQADSDIFSSGGLTVESFVAATVASVATELASANNELTYLGQTEIAARIGKSVQAVNSLRKRGQLPAPAFSVALGDLWASDVIDAWHQEREAKR